MDPNYYGYEYPPPPHAEANPYASHERMPPLPPAAAVPMNFPRSYGYGYPMNFSNNATSYAIDPSTYANNHPQYHYPVPPPEVNPIVEQGVEQAATKTQPPPPVHVPRKKIPGVSSAYQTGDDFSATGPWSFHEHSLFEQSCIMYGWGNWKKIQEAIPGRSKDQCKSHGQKFLKHHPGEKERLIAEHRKLLSAHRQKASTVFLNQERKLLGSPSKQPAKKKSSEGLKNNKSSVQKRAEELKNDNGMAFCWMRYPQAEEIAHSAAAAEEVNKPAQLNMPEHATDGEQAKKKVKTIGIADKLAEDTVKPLDQSAAEETIESAEPTVPEQENYGESPKKEARAEGYPNEAIEIAEKLAEGTFDHSAIEEINESTQPTTLPGQANNGEPGGNQDEAVENANKLAENSLKPSVHSGAEDTIESAQPTLPDDGKPSEMEANTEGNQDDDIEIAEKSAEETMEPVQVTLRVQANDKETLKQEAKTEDDPDEALEKKNKLSEGAVDGSQANPTESAEGTGKLVQDTDKPSETSPIALHQPHHPMVYEKEPSVSERETKEDSHNGQPKFGFESIDAICLGIHERKLKNVK